MLRVFISNLSLLVSFFLMFISCFESYEIFINVVKKKAITLKGKRHLPSS